MKKPSTISGEHVDFLEEAYCDIESLNALVDATIDTLTEIEGFTRPGGVLTNETLWRGAGQGKLLLFMSGEKMGTMKERLRTVIEAAYKARHEVMGKAA